MAILDLDHVGIAVHSLEKARSSYQSLLGTSPRIHTVEDQQARIGVYELRSSRVELLEPLADDSPIGNFLASEDEGLHHVALRTDDASGELDRAEQLEDVVCIDETPRTGAEDYSIAFLHPKSFHGALLELAEPPGPINY